MTVRVLRGDCRDVLKTLPDESVHMVVASPPYFGLRDYGTAKWEGGEPGCDHSKGTAASGKSTLKNDGRVNFGSNDYEYSIVVPYRSECGKCGARRVDSQIGLEPTPDAYVAEMVTVFREVRRVLRKDGTCWLNLGDSYAGSWGAQGHRSTDSDEPSWHGLQIRNHPKRASNTGSIRQVGLKPKDLIGIPWRVAFALQADGWWLRQDIIWSKPNPMPESVTDRCTKAHEYIFLLTKAERYHFDAAAIAEPGVGRETYFGSDRYSKGSGRNDSGSYNDDNCQTRNKRSVWTVATQPFSGAHFATFPPALIEPCILAGCPAKACTKCGAPWVREVERIDAGYDGSKYGERAVAASGGAITGGTARSTLGSINGKLTGKTETLGFSPSCSCNAGTMPGTVLDPFGGAGTTGLVADRLQRNAVLIELNPSYAAMAEQRVTADAPLFATVGT